MLMRSIGALDAADGRMGKRAGGHGRSGRSARRFQKKTTAHHGFVFHRLTLRGDRKIVHKLFEWVVSVNRPAQEARGGFKRDFRGHPKSKPGDLSKLTARTRFSQ